MDIIAALRPFLRDVARVDHTKLSIVTPLRNALGTILPLAAGAATGQLLAGLTVSIGALNVAFSDMLGAYRVRAERMLLASAEAALSVFAGSATGAIDALAVALAVAWGFGEGIGVIERMSPDHEVRKEPAWFGRRPFRTPPFRIGRVSLARGHPDFPCQRPVNEHLSAR